MSNVRVGDRKESPLIVLSIAKTLCVKTMHICKQEKIFPKNQRWLLTSKIVNEATEVYALIRRANKYPLRQGQFLDEDYRARRNLQLEANTHLDALIGFMDIAYELNNISDQTIIEWIDLAESCKEKLSAWMRENAQRYQRLRQ